MSSPTFSVVIAVYNGEATIQRAIDSVLSQSFAAHEIIVVDDGSTDNTATLVNHFPEPVMYVHQQNAGVAAARNAGVAMASGEWVAFLDADDYYYPDRLKWQAELLTAWPDVDFMTGDFDYVNPQGEVIRRSMESTPAGRELLDLANERPSVLMVQQQLGAFIASHFGDTHTLAMPRKTFMALGGYPVGIAVCEDVNLLIRLCAQSQSVGVVCQPMAAYVIHENSATRSNPLRAQQQTVAALLPLRITLRSAPKVIRDGLEECIRIARMDLAYSLLKHDRRWSALKAVLPLLTEHPSVASLKDVASVAKG